MIILLNLRIRLIIFKHHLRTTTRTNHRLHIDSFESYLLYSYIMPSHAPLLTIALMEKIENFVDDIPDNVTAPHGGADDLTKKITDLIFPTTTEEINQHTTPSEPSKKRGRPKGSKNKPKDDISADVPLEPKKRGRPKGSTNKSKTDITADVPAPPKKRGRPKGSKNKPKDDITTDVPSQPKKRGRPSKLGHIVKTTPRTCSVCGQTGHNKRSCPMC